MNGFAHLCRAAALVGACAASSFAWAAAPESLETDLAVPEAMSAPGTIYELDTEMVVHNWVLCVSESVAERLARAREESAENARTAYASLKDERKCGLFPELRVILQKALYRSAAESGHDARVFGALVNLADNWASVYVVMGSLPEE